MPPVTRRQASQQQTTATQPSQSAPIARWFWAGDSPHGMQDILIEFNAQQSQLLESAYQSKTPRVDVDLERFVNLTDMTQRRKNNPNRVRQVQRIETQNAGAGAKRPNTSITSTTAATAVTAAASVSTAKRVRQTAATATAAVATISSATASSVALSSLAAASASSASTPNSTKASSSGTPNAAKLQAMVDCAAHRSTHRVYADSSGVWDAMLNQTDVSYNIKGHNKFYLIQLLEPVQPRGSIYYVSQRWGRVGSTGSDSIQGPMSLQQAIAVFEQKFNEKTKNIWANRQNFKKVPGKYDLIFRTFENDDDDDEENKKSSKKADSNLPPAPVPQSQLDKPLQNLIDMIFNIKAMEAAMISMNFDTKKAPLGKLTKQQVKAGYEALKKIEEAINQSKPRTELIDANNDFYTKIPHDFGMQKPPMIDTIPKVQEKVKLLEALADIEIAMKVMKQTSDVPKNPIDEHYDTLKCDLAVLSTQDPDYTWIEKYMKDSHGATHRYKLDIVEVFKVNRHGEDQRFRHDLHNRQLLWHGSRITNFVGILSQGLRIAPPEAPVTGYMFGKGVYFADACSKSANYCHCIRTGDEGILLLCDVALGDVNELYQADYNADKNLKGKHSVLGKGSHTPDPNIHHKIDNGKVHVPYGKLIDAPKGPRYSLLYNEYIVYNVDQVKVRYLLRVKFTY